MPCKACSKARAVCRGRWRRARARVKASSRARPAWAVPTGPRTAPAPIRWGGSATTTTGVSTAQGGLNAGEGLAERARQVLEELRRRLGDRLRPQDEQDYLERLLKRY